MGAPGVRHDRFHRTHTNGWKSTFEVTMWYEVLLLRAASVTVKAASMQKSI